MKDGKQPDDLNVGTGEFGQPQTVFENPCPMADAVIAVERQHVLVEDGSKNNRDFTRHEHLAMALTFS